MTRTTNARLAGFTFLFYIAVGITEMILLGAATRGAGTAEKLANLAQHAPQMRLAAVLSLVTTVCALVLAVTLYALTRDYDRDLALLALLCRVLEGVNNSASVVGKLQLLSVATAAAGAAAPDAAAANALGSFLMHERIGNAAIFAVGSTIYCYLFLRARTIPAWLASFGLLASLLLLVGLPLQVLRVMEGGFNWFLWFPALVFEVIFALWLLIKGVAAQPIRPTLVAEGVA